MTEKQREALYWRILLMLAGLFPVTFYIILQSESRIDPALNPVPWMLLIPLAAPVVLELLVDQIFGMKMVHRWLVKHPVVEKEFPCKIDISTFEALMTERAGEMGFTIRREVFDETGPSWILDKAKSGQVHTFTDHAFNGVVYFPKGNHEAVVIIRLQLLDTLLLETG